MRYTVRPISDRTAFTGDPVNSKFTVSWSVCLMLLEHELDHLEAENIVIEADFAESEIRLDGMPRSNARAASPAVRLAFNSSVGSLVYATDAFVKPAWQRKGMQQDWQHNLYAIALGLEALRKVDRYGISKRGEQYTGYKAIGAGSGATAVGGMTATVASAIIVEASGNHHHKGPVPSRLYRLARANSHPDRNGGDRSKWDRVEQAAKVLGLTS